MEVKLKKNYNPLSLQEGKGNRNLLIILWCKTALEHKLCVGSNMRVRGKLMQS